MKQRKIDIKTYFLNVSPQPRWDKNIITNNNLLDNSGKCDTTKGEIESKTKLMHPPQDGQVTLFESQQSECNSFHFSLEKGGFEIN